MRFQLRSIAMISLIHISRLFIIGIFLNFHISLTPDLDDRGGVMIIAYLRAEKAIHYNRNHFRYSDLVYGIFRFRSQSLEDLF